MAPVLPVPLIVTPTGARFPNENAKLFVPALGPSLKVIKRKFGKYSISDSAIDPPPLKTSPWNASVWSSVIGYPMESVTRTNRFSTVPTVSEPGNPFRVKSEKGT